MTDLDPLTLLFMEPGASDDPAPAYARLRNECPVARVAGLSGEMTVWVSTYEDSLWALKHPEVFSSAAEAIDIGQSHDLIPLQVDPPLHSRYRRFLAEWFNSRAIAPLEPESAGSSTSCSTTSRRPERATSTRPSPRRCRRRSSWR